MTNKPVIIFGDYISAYGVIRGLSKYQIPMYIVSSAGKGVALKSRYIRSSITIAPNDSEFILKLDDWISKEVGQNPVLIVAGEDKYLDVLSQRHNELKNDVILTFPDWEVVKLVREKQSTYNVAEKVGVPRPKTYFITTEEELYKLIREPQKELKFPMFMKAGHSSIFMANYGIKGCVCENKEDLLLLYKKYDGFDGELILQDLISSEKEIIKTVLMAVNRNSNPVGVMINEKKRSEGEYLSGSLVESTWSDELLEHSLKLVKEIGYYGYAGVQFKYDYVDREFKFLEINGRISMSNAIALRCGINLPYLMYQNAIGAEVPEITVFKQTYPDKILWWLMVNDIIGYFRWNKRFYSVPQFIKSVIGKGYTIEPMNWRDPLPGLITLMLPVRILLNRIFKKNKK